MTDPLALTTDSLESLSPARVRSYLLGGGWVDDGPFRSNLGRIFRLPRLPRGAVVLPVDPDLGDFAEMMGDLVIALAVVEERKAWAVLNDLLLPDGDIFRFRFEAGFARRGSVPLDVGRNLVINSRRSIWAAANSAHQPQPAYVSEQYSAVGDLLQRCQMGQTEVGSFVVTVVVPVVKPIPTLFASLDDDPYARRVSKTLMTGLSLLRNGAERRPVNEVAAGVDRGVSANLCDAVTEMLPKTESAVLDIAVRWSGVVDLGPLELPPAVRFFHSDEDYLKSASHVLKGARVETNVRIEGWVSDLHAKVDIRDESVQNGTIDIVRSDDQKGAKVRVKLGEQDFRTAGRAFLGKRKVVVVGKLTKASGEQVPWIREYLRFQVYDPLND